MNHVEAEEENGNAPEEVVVDSEKKMTSILTKEDTSDLTTLMMTEDTVLQDTLMTSTSSHQE